MIGKEDWCDVGTHPQRVRGAGGRDRLREVKAGRMGGPLRHTEAEERTCFTQAGPNTSFTQAGVICSAAPAGGIFCFSSSASLSASLGPASTVTLVETIQS